ncbi:hypothetical protein D3C77_574560 [compost metagenome]
MANRLVDKALFEEPVPGDRMEFALLFLGLTAQVVAQDFAQQRMEAVPGFPVVALDLSNEQVLAVQAGQLAHHPGNGMRLADQPGTQGRGKAVAKRSAGQQLQVSRGQVLQHFLLEVLCKCTRTTNLHAVKATAVLGLQVDREQLQAGHPAIGQVVQDLGVVLADLTKLLA